MNLTPDDVKKVASLARLEFSGSQLEEFTDQFVKILRFVEQLDAVETAGIEPLSHPLDIHSVLRDDEPTASLDRSSALANAPGQDGEFFLVPPVL